MAQGIKTTAEFAQEQANDSGEAQVVFRYRGTQNFDFRGMEHFAHMKKMGGRSDDWVYIETIAPQSWKGLV
jgi:hypothetical protein